MKKIIVSLLLALSIFLSFGNIQNSSANNTKYGDYLKKIKDDKDIEVSISGTNVKENLYDTTLKIAEVVKIIFFIAVVIYFMIITIKLIVSNNTEEELSNFKKGILWISVGLILINLAESIVKIVFNKNFGWDTVGLKSNSLAKIGKSIVDDIINPFIHLLEFGAAFFFILIMIFAFFRLITSNGDEEKAKSGKMTVLYAIIGFIVVKIASTLVFAVYGSCKSKIAGLFGATCNPSTGANLSGFSKIIFDIINWMNSFVAIVVIILIIFIGAQIIFSNGDEEKMSKAKKSILYIVIGIAILLFNYLILTFFFNTPALTT